MISSLKCCSNKCWINKSELEGERGRDSLVSTAFIRFNPLRRSNLVNKSPPIPGLDTIAPFSENLSRENRRAHIGGFVLIRDGEAADPRSAVHRSCLYPPPMGLPRVEKLRRIYRSKTSLASGCKWKLMRTLGILARLRWSDSLSLSLCTGLNCFSRWFIGPNLDTTGSKSILLLRGPLSTGVLVALCIER